MPRLYLLGAAWLAWIVGLLIERRVGDLGSLAIGASIGAVLVWVGFAAASRCRTVPRITPGQWPLVATLAIGIGALMGFGNLAANWLIAQAHPALRVLLARRVTTLDPWIAVIGAPIVEEIALRLFLLSVIAWIVLRMTERPTLAFASAVILSSVLFALLHLARPMPDSPSLANFYRLALLVKYTLTALPLGWLFWRWGLPYAILGHAAANAAHLVAQSFAF